MATSRRPSCSRMTTPPAATASRTGRRPERICFGTDELPRYGCVESSQREASSLVRSLALACVVSLGGCPIGSLPAPPPAATASVSSHAPIATSSATSPSPTTAARLPGSITGKLGYPSEMIPPLRVYAVDTSSPDRYRVVHTAANQPTYTLAGVAPGTYIVFAHNYTISAKGLIGGYKRNFTCACPDHTLVPVRVADGQ